MRSYLEDIGVDKVGGKMTLRDLKSEEDQQESNLKLEDEEAV
jgi:hypothetical protein